MDVDACMHRWLDCVCIGGWNGACDLRLLCKIYIYIYVLPCSEFGAGIFYFSKLSEIAISGEL